MNRVREGLFSNVMGTDETGVPQFHYNDDGEKLVPTGAVFCIGGGKIILMRECSGQDWILTIISCNYFNKILFQLISLMKMVFILTKKKGGSNEDSSQCNRFHIVGNR